MWRRLVGSGLPAGEFVSFEFLERTLSAEIQVGSRRPESGGPLVSWA